MKWQLGEQGQVTIRAGEDILRIEKHKLAEAWVFFDGLSQQRNE